MATNDFITWELEKRTIKVYHGNKHVKSLPKIYEPVMDMVSLNFETKRLLQEEKTEINKILFPFLKTSFEENLKTNEKYVFELIQNAEFKGVREVEVFKKNKRIEAIYSQNNIERAIECDRNFFIVCPEKLPLRFSNY